MSYGEFSYYSDSPTTIIKRKTVGTLSEILVGMRVRYDDEVVKENELVPEATYVIVALATPCLTSSLHSQNFMCGLVNEETGECRVTLLTNLKVLKKKECDKESQ